jgi:hypothetical protein
VKRPATRQLPRGRSAAEAQLTSAPAASAVPPQPQSPVSLPPQPLTTAAVSLLPLPLSLLCLMLGTCGTPQSLDAAATATVSARQSAQRSDRSVTGKRRITDTAEAAQSEWQEAEGGDRRAAIRAYEDGMKVRRSSRTSSSLHFSHAVGLPAAASPLHVLSTARATCFICRSLISLNAGGRASATSTTSFTAGACAGSGCGSPAALEAPVASMARTTAVWPYCMAVSRPVMPFLLRRIVSHPACTSAAATSA